MHPPVAVTLYDTILALHIAAVMIAFGATFAYAVVFPIAQRHPAFLPVFYEMLHVISRRVILPGLLVILAAGVYMTAKRHAWHEFWVQWALGAVVVIGWLESAVLARWLVSMRALAAKEKKGKLSPPHLALIRRYAIAGGFLDLLVLVTIWIMSAKPGS